MRPALSELPAQIGPLGIKVMFALHVAVTAEP